MSDYLKKVLLGAAIALLLLSVSTVHVQAAKNGASVGEETLKVGKTLDLSKKNAYYESSDSSIAYVSDEGIVTGKKPGAATIEIEKGGKVTKVNVTVKENRGKNKIKVCADEIEIVDEETVYEPVYSEDNPDQIQEYRYTSSLMVINRSASASGKIEIKAAIGDEKMTVCQSSLEGDEESEFLMEGTCSVEDREEGFELIKLSVVSCKLLHVHNFETDTYALKFTGKDTTPPVISGLVGKNSYNEDMPCRVVYSDDEDYDFLKYVKAVDDRDGKVKVRVKTNKVNFNRTGTYEITYVAEDSAGNVAKAKAKIGVRVANDLDAICDDLLSRLTKKSWSDTKKVRAIYSYARHHIAYVGTSDKSSWEKAAKDGIRYGVGDCFTYYAVACALCTRAGIMNIRVNRVRGHGRHWWNMVYVQGGFYHFDACPRTRGGDFCMVTDAQLKEYSAHYGNSHIWAYDEKPKTPTKKISSVW